jgi:DegV family protein with EDD domain
MTRGRAVALVTDSTCSLSGEGAAGLGITVVPLQVILGGRVLSEDGEATPAAVAEALGRWVPVTTSRPAPEAFVAAYAAAAAAGAESIVSVHLSAEISGTFASATLAAEASPIPVEVVDSRLVGMGLGFAVLAGVRAREAGGKAEEVAAAIRECAAGTAVYFYVDTLEHLRRGGRIGSAQAVLGSVLSVKPILHLVDGHIRPLEKVRTSTRAVARLEEIATARAAAAGPGGAAAVELAVQHLAASDRAQSLAARLRTRLPGLRSLHVSEIGAVVGAHVGPGMLAVVVAPAGTGPA